jgi:glycosyltransferase involved in cell wall biosynthesis
MSKDVIVDIENNKIPLVTFVLFSYNQERFIQQAVIAALNQTYERLQIIISDDASVDNTFQIIKNEVNKYSGNHNVIVFQNELNIGIGSHINKISQIADGELIIVAAGDDISLPQRTQKIVDNWIDGNKEKSSICSACTIIDENDTIIGSMQGFPFDGSIEEGMLKIFSGLHGATHAWRKDVFQIFGGMHPETICEDRVIPLRSAFLGGFGYVPDSLVKYRIHGDNVSHHYKISRDKVIDRTINIYRRNKNIYEIYCRDLVIARKYKLCNDEEFNYLNFIAYNHMVKFEDKIDFMEGGIKVKLQLIWRYKFSNFKQAFVWLFIVLAPSLHIRFQAKNLGIR